jgi:hypothetical protein
MDDVRRRARGASDGDEFEGAGGEYRLNHQYGERPNILTLLSMPSFEA